MLGYISKQGDENLAVYNYKKSNPNIKNLSQDLLQREQHKYDLYMRYDQIVFREEQVFEIDIGEDFDQPAASGNIDIDWAQIEDTNVASGDATDQTWEIIKEDQDDKKSKQDKEDLNKYNEEETLLYNQETR